MPILKFLLYRMGIKVVEEASIDRFYQNFNVGALMHQITKTSLNITDTLHVTKTNTGATVTNMVQQLNHFCDSWRTATTRSRILLDLDGNITAQMNAAKFMVDQSYNKRRVWEKANRNMICDFRNPVWDEAREDMDIPEVNDGLGQEDNLGDGDEEGVEGDN
jgi:hypothetical protein